MLNYHNGFITLIITYLQFGEMSFLAKVTFIHLIYFVAANVDVFQRCNRFVKLNDLCLTRKINNYSYKVKVAYYEMNVPLELAKLYDIFKPINTRDSESELKAYQLRRHFNGMLDDVIASDEDRARKQFWPES